jgi:nitrogen fixation/metabolism regulation signal transduction histidine kinase
MKFSVSARIALVVSVIVVANIVAGAVSWYLYSAAAQSGAEARAAAERARLVAVATTGVTEFMAGATDLAYSVSRPTASEERSRLYGALIGVYPVVDRAIANAALATPGTRGASAQHDWQTLRDTAFAWINSEAAGSGATLRITRDPNGTFRDSGESNITLPSDLSGISGVTLRQAIRDRAEHFNVSTLGDLAKDARQEAAAAATAEAQARSAAQTGTIAFVGLSTLVAALLGFWLYRSIAKPLQAATLYADSVASGHYEATLAKHSGDEIGVLTHAVENMKDNLVREMNVIREMAGVVMFTAEGVKDAVSSATEQINKPDGEDGELKAGLADVESRVDLLQELSRQMLGI